MREDLREIQRKKQSGETVPKVSSQAPHIIQNSQSGNLSSKLSRKTKRLFWLKYYPKVELGIKSSPNVCFLWHVSSLCMGVISIHSSLGRHTLNIYLNGTPAPSQLFFNFLDKKRDLEIFTREHFGKATLM